MNYGTSAIGTLRHSPRRTILSAVDQSGQRRRLAGDRLSAPAIVYPVYTENLIRREFWLSQANFLLLRPKPVPPATTSLLAIFLPLPLYWIKL
jgi:hypothetical protein